MSTHNSQSAQQSIAADSSSLKQPQNLQQTHSAMQQASSQPSNESGRNTPGLNHPFPLNLQSFDPTTDIYNHTQPDLDAALASAFPEFDSGASPYIPSDIDWLLSSTNDPLSTTAAPAPDQDQFERDLEQALAGFEPSQINYINNLNTVDFSQQQFSLYRGAPTSLSHPGPHSAITASSESAYGDDRSESHYNPYSPQGSLVNAANPSHFNAAIYQALENFSVDLAAFGISDTQAAIQPSQTTRGSLANHIQPPSVNFDQLMPSSTASGHSFSFSEESGNSMRDNSPNELGNSDDGEREFGTSTNLVGSYQQVPPQSAIDPRKKYQCPNCPRAFARAFNLKTHMATHDPNRLKPHVCNHPGCGRSFSRKHDLGRHLVSIHKDESGLKMTNGGGESSSSTYGVSGHPLPHVNAHSNAGRIHQVGSTGVAAAAKGSTTPTASTNFMPNIALGSLNANSSYIDLGGSFIKTEPVSNVRALALTSTAGRFVTGSFNSGAGVGVAASGIARGWCDTCGNGWVGHRRACKCGGELESKIKIKT